MAIGYAGMAKLEAVSARLALNFRSLFKGVDPSPLIRGFEKFTQNFSLTTVTGRAFGDIMTRAFNGVFILLEKFEPIASGIFQGMVLGAMVAEEGLLRLEIAFAPAIVAIEDFLASSNGMAIAGKAGMVAMGGLAAYAVVAAAPILAVGAAIAAVTAALDQFMKLQKEWDDQSSSQVWTKFKHDIGVTSDAEFSKEQGKRSGMVTGAEYDKLHPPAPPVPKPKPAEAAAAGTDTGAALGTGIVAGMKGKEAEVAAAGAGLAKAADKGVREAAKIHSPSRLMREKGRFMGDGLEEGLEDSKAGVQNSASSNLVPGVGGAGGGMGGGEKHFHFDFSGLTSGNKEDIEEVCRRVINEEVWKMAVQAGAPA